ncbi:RagB/SusD family nutrient uptake outer membrane protein [Sediminibacterium ginsengisoli]|uniref:Starch-binding associating with outer membrane n=1 Tax=Sediminibacterium ginsengisoli TaxID=413434 RepID=A0A1T4PAK2_9BACT|nr:RagB/SusD family nutrient uptake outer membrane protein [Sediminibacterium ginsengisoli]SJZ88286.1 Starch-binding associating with outer membrane [Sediminibacterium ginsengisoli]
MKRYHQYIILLFCIAMTACNKVIDLYPQSNLNTGTYYSNLEEVRAALTGCYNGLQKPMASEWQFTELRSDNTKQGVPGSTASTNRDLSDLDMFVPSTSHAAIYTYWLATYNNIHNVNLVLQKLGVSYDAAAGTINFNAINIPIADGDRKKLAAEALFIRGYHYFNLVRLFGGVFLVTDPISPAEAKTMNRASVADIYKLIEADMKAAAANGINTKFTLMAAGDIGKANSWAAKGLLAKVYLTMNRKSDAIPLLQDVMTNSGYSLQGTYANVFSVSNEMNSEIIFAVRYKAGGIGLGSPFANAFAPLSSGSAVVNGDGKGLNYPTAEIDTAFISTDARRAVSIGVYGSGTAAKLYVKKYVSTVAVADDAENDWPVLRFADILLMLAEAQGFVPNSISLINQVRARSLPVVNPGPGNIADFEQLLANERRLEFAFENQRWFDLVRFNTTLTTIKAEQRMKDHFANEYNAHYKLYTAPALTLAELQGAVVANKLILPIPQREIDNNTQLKIAQNPGY